MKPCAYCGRENEDDAVYCRECGTTEFQGEVAKTTPKPPPLPPPPPAVLAPPVPRLLPPALMTADFVLLLRCRTLFEADLISSWLAAAGIRAFIPDEFLMQLVCWNLNTYGYVRVQVPPKDYTDARELLETASQSASSVPGQN